MDNTRNMPPHLVAALEVLEDGIPEGLEPLEYLGELKAGHNSPELQKVLDVARRRSDVNQREALTALCVLLMGSLESAQDAIRDALGGQEPEITIETRHD